MGRMTTTDDISDNQWKTSTQQYEDGPSELYPVKLRRATTRAFMALDGTTFRRGQDGSTTTCLCRGERGVCPDRIMLHKASSGQRFDTVADGGRGGGVMVGLGMWIILRYL